MSGEGRERENVEMQKQVVTSRGNKAKKKCNRKRRKTIHKRKHV